MGRRISEILGIKKVTPEKVRHKILVIEDEAGFKAVIGRLLAAIDSSLEIDWASSGHEAIEKIALVTYDLVIADIFLTGKITGLDVWEMCWTKCPQTPYVFMSGMQSGQFDAITKKYGISPPYLMKPLEVDRWYKMIKGVLTNYAPVHRVPGERSTS